MLCDELKAYTLFTTSSLSGQRVYLTNKVDEAIAELKEKLHDAEMAKDDAECANTEYREDIKKLKAQFNPLYEELKRVKDENAELKFKLKKIDDNFAIKAKLVYERHERQTIRALWLARADRAKDRAMTCNDFAYLGDTEREINMALARTWMKCRMLKPSEWSKVWHKVEKLCMAKAEQYKEDV